MTNKSLLHFTFSLGAFAWGVWGVRKALTYVKMQIKRNALLTQYERQLIPSKAQLECIIEGFLSQMKTGLERSIDGSGHHLMMLPTFVTRLPTGDEQGDCYAIDMGGTNFRVMHARLGGNQVGVELESELVSIPKEIYTSSGTDLFDFLAAKLSDYITTHGGDSSLRLGRLPVVGFCFSFALEQTALNAGRLLTWTKGFTCTGVVGEDPVTLLAEALERRGCPCNVAAIINDTVGVLASGRYMDEHTEIGIILGTGTNASYVEKVSQMVKWSAPADIPQNAQTIVNVEWGAFDSLHLPRCEEDWKVAAQEPQPRAYLFEKLISGLYLGEVVRYILLRFVNDAALFGHLSITAASALSIPGRITTAHIATIVDDTHPWLETVGNVLQEVLGLQLPYSGRKMVQRICVLVSRRSALLVATGTLSIMRHIGWTEAPRKISIAVDGGVYEKFASYRQFLANSMADLLDQRPELASLISFRLNREGSCLGAVVIAAAEAGCIQEGITSGDAE